MSKSLLNKVETILEKENISYSSVRASIHNITGYSTPQYAVFIDSKADFEQLNGRMFELESELINELNTHIRENL